MRGWPAEDEIAAAIAARAAAAGVVLDAAAAQGLARHALAVHRESPVLHLTSIADWPEFLERHLGESLEGAALLPDEVSGPLLDLGSGNGYPGIPVALSRPGLALMAAESSSRKASFLRLALERAGLAGRGQILERRVERAADVADLPPLSVVATRAMGGWERIVPRVAGRLGPGAWVLLWAGDDAAGVVRRTAWRTLRLQDRRPLPGRARSALWVLRPTERSAGG